MLNDYNKLREYNKAIEEKFGLEDSNIFNFVDGTFRGVCRSVEEQEKIYSGYKKRHGIKFQGVIFPDGLLILDGPYEGKANDWVIWNASGVEQRLREVCISESQFIQFQLLSNASLFRQ